MNKDMNNLKKYISLVFTAFIICSTAIAQNTPAAFKVPAYEKFVLPNGLSVYLMEQHEVPVISLSVIIPAGAIYDGAQSGLASLTAAGLQYGTKSYSKIKIEEELDFIGASLNTYANKESAGLSSKFASKDLDKVIPIVKEVLVDPIFDQEEFEKERKRVLSGLDQAKLSPRNVINAYWDKFIFGDHVYSNPVSGSPQSVGKFNIEDLKGFYKSNYGPQGSAISIVGDFNAQEMKIRLRNLFAGWKKTGSVQKGLAAQPVKQILASRVLLVNKEDAERPHFILEDWGFVVIIRIVLRLML